jgi:hypothetical protein
MEGHELRVFVNKGPKRISGPKREEVKTEGQRN